MSAAVALVIDTRSPKPPTAISLGGYCPAPEHVEQPLAPVVELVPEPAPAPEPVAVTPPRYDPPPPPAPWVVSDDLTDQLAHLVPAHPGAHAADLLRLLALKLDGHRDCHQLIHPAPGTLDLIQVRARCIALIDTLPRAERLAVVGLLADDLGSRP